MANGGTTTSSSSSFSPSSFSSLLTFITFFFSAALALLLSPALSETDWGDIQALKLFKQSVDPNSLTPGSCLTSWDFSADPCDSLFTQRFTCGLRCDLHLSSGSSRVTELSLDSAAYYSSSLPSSSSFQLPYLQVLQLSPNYFSGPLPLSLSTFTSLRRLDLSRNSFTGEIPDSLGWSLPYLEELSLGYNNLQGRVPPSLNRLHSLKRLELQGNQLSGDFPDLSSLDDLIFLDASENSISGELPSDFSPYLEQICMRSNYLRGTIPTNIQTLNYLQVLDLSHNNLSGPVPYFVFSHPSLQQLTLSDNDFEYMEIPGNYGTQSKLIAVDLSKNQLQGMVPDFLAYMPRLSAVSLEENYLTGFIPTQLAMKTVVPGFPLERLMLGGNYLFGPIPSPLLALKPGGGVTISLADNCLFRCPQRFFFCDGGDQKSVGECRSFDPVIP